MGIKLMIPTTLESYRLLHDGALALADIEAHGMRIDVGYLNASIKSLVCLIEKGTQKLRESQFFQTWRQTHGMKTNIGSRVQLADVLFRVMGHPCPAKTPTGKSKGDEEALRTVDTPFVKNYLRVEKWKKMKNTYLEGIKREVVDGFLHPFFNLHTVKTYRSSSDSPNFQNIPVRDPEMGALIRRCFLPREGHVLIEMDYSGIEVRIAACYHKDPAMLAYIQDPDRDMHRDMAAECFLCSPGEVSKETRYYGKNQFVFPEFYGSYYLQCAPNLWQTMEKLYVGNTPMREWVASKGIKSLGSLDPKVKSRKGTYVHHIKQVEENFWGNRFPVYAKWKKNWFAQYQKTGGFTMLTGFCEQGVLSRNDAINHPVQGAAFHCLLWSLIKINEFLRKTKKKSLIIGQIHDSIVADVHVDELDEYLVVARRIMTIEIREAWPWIILPLEVEAEACRLGETWADKKEIEIP